MGVRVDSAYAVPGDSQVIILQPGTHVWLKCKGTIYHGQQLVASSDGSVMYAPNDSDDIIGTAISDSNDGKLVAVQISAPISVIEHQIKQEDDDYWEVD